MNVHLVVPDLLWPDTGAAPVGQTERLGALEQLFAKGRRTRASATHLDAWLLEAWRAQGGAAAYALLAEGGTPGEANWLRADPCHLRVSSDHLVLIDATMFEISRDEAEALVEGINRHFAEDGVVCYAMQPERWYVRAEDGAPLDTRPLALARGRPVEARPGAGGGPTRWDAFANELQMLLHQHPVNEAREERGELPVNGVWFWGGGRFAAPARNPFHRVRTDEPLAAGLARAAGAAVLPRPDTAERWLRASGQEGVELIVLDVLSAPASYDDAATWRERLMALEHDWFAPLLDALRSGRIGVITLHAIGARGTIDVETTRQDLRYFWRRSRPIPTYVSAS